jgi:hypothetical protein
MDVLFECFYAVQLVNKRSYSVPKFSYLLPYQLYTLYSFILMNVNIIMFFE